MINLDIDNIQRRTYRRLITKLTNIQVETLINLEQFVTRSINDAVYAGKWCVDNIRIDDFDVLRIIMADLQMKGFKVGYVSEYENSISKRMPYYNLEINWELEN